MATPVSRSLLVPLWVIVLVLGVSTVAVIFGGAPALLNLRWVLGALVTLLLVLKYWDRRPPSGPLQAVVTM